MSTSGTSTPRRAPSMDRSLHSVGGTRSLHSVASTTHPVPYVSDNFLDKLNAAAFGAGKTFCMYAIVAAIFCTLFFITGVTLLGMFLTGYLFNFTLEWVIAVFFVLFAVSLALVIYFYSKARVKSSSGRRNVKFRAAGDHQVSVVNVGYENDTQKDDDLVSGKVTNKAVLHVDAPYEQKRAQKYRKAGQPGSRTRSESSQISGDSLDRPPSYREQAMVNAV